MRNKIAVLCASMQAFRAHVDEKAKGKGAIAVYKRGIANVGDCEYVAVMSDLHAMGRTFIAVERANDFRMIERCYDLEDIVRRRIR